MSNDTFLQIILPLKDKLFRLALSIVREQYEAEDIIQDVLLRLWSKKDEWDGIENLEAYCFRAVKNTAFDRLTSLAIRKTQHLDQEKENFIFVDDHSPYNKMVQEEQRLVIHKCIDELPETQKLVFQLREIEGMSYREIAGTLDISEDLVKISLFRARKKMRERLSDFENNEY